MEDPISIGTAEFGGSFSFFGVHGIIKKDG
jgi:hypothetical protein